jgi:hypothetical protein
VAAAIPDDRVMRMTRSVILVTRTDV